MLQQVGQRMMLLPDDVPTLFQGSQVIVNEDPVAVDDHCIGNEVIDAGYDDNESMEIDVMDETVSDVADKESMLEMIDDVSEENMLNIQSESMADNVSMTEKKRKHSDV
ncbi:uncharacterized protein LOC114527413 [Dendronephthya gigantea]|uniref:uncharacterized protein LOC114527413 n=1 Tax=Dendronephthya gigantea TaxID=151771 RepID=UPI00106BF908|nr:uncharacterized protein LOC114527413 [Dendronephthya gigantea]